MGEWTDQIVARYEQIKNSEASAEDKLKLELAMYSVRWAEQEIGTP